MKAAVLLLSAVILALAYVTDAGHRKWLKPKHVPRLVPVWESDPWRKSHQWAEPVYGWKEPEDKPWESRGHGWEPEHRPQPWVSEWKPKKTEVIVVEEDPWEGWQPQEEKEVVYVIVPKETDGWE